MKRKMLKTVVVVEEAENKKQKMNKVKEKDKKIYCIIIVEDRDLLCRKSIIINLNFLFFAQYVRTGKICLL